MKKKKEVVSFEKNKETETNLNVLELLEEGIENDRIETSLTAKVLSLQGKGLNIDEIAKELKCRQTEIELILKFQG